MLGWSILRKGEYNIPLRSISTEESKIVHDLVDKVREVYRENSVDMTNTRSTISDLLSEYCSAEGILLDNEQISTLIEWVQHTAFGFYFLDYILRDNNVEEIAVISPGEPVYVYIRKKGWKRTNCCVDTEEDLMQLVNKLIRTTGRRLTYRFPVVDAVLPDGSRLHATISPISKGEMTIRKFTHKPILPSEMISSNFITAEAMQFLQFLMKLDLNIIIVGNTASGKTTMLNTLFLSVPKNERVVIIEQTPEVSIPHPHKVRLVENDDMGISLKRLVYDSLRMRPDRLIVGEVRNTGEAEALFDVMLGGQARGTYATLHGRTPEEAIKRLHSFGIDTYSLLSIDVIICQRRMLGLDLKEKRRVVSICMLDKTKDPIDEDAIVKIYEYNPKLDRLVKKRFDYAISYLLSLGIPRSKVYEELGIDVKRKCKRTNRRNKKVHV